jgi:hypothetical protein
MLRNRTNATSRCLPLAGTSSLDSSTPPESVRGLPFSPLRLSFPFHHITSLCILFLLGYSIRPLVDVRSYHNMAEPTPVLERRPSMGRERKPSMSAPLSDLQGPVGPGFSRPKHKRTVTGFGAADIKAVEASIPEPQRAAYVQPIPRQKTTANSRLQMEGLCRLRPLRRHCTELTAFSRHQSPLLHQKSLR